MFAEPQAKVLIKTRTGEPYQPCRLYYEVTNQKTVVGAFKKLRCLHWEPQLQAWRWHYEQEAKKLRFDVSWNHIPKEHRPLVLGDFYLRSDREMVLDVRSFQRAMTAILFFDKHINRRAAHLTKLRIVNKFFNANDKLGNEQLHPPFDYFFERLNIEIPDAVAFQRELEQIVQSTGSDDSKRQAFSEFLEQKAKQPLPEIEEIPVHFYEDGIAPLEMALTMRNIEAMQHWQGNKSFSQHDLIADMIASLKGEFDDIDRLAEDEPDLTNQEIPDGEPTT